MQKLLYLCVPCPGTKTITPMNVNGTATVYVIAITFVYIALLIAHEHKRSLTTKVDSYWNLVHT